MNTQKRECEYLEERDIELLLAYRKAVAEVQTIYIPDLMKRVVNTSCSRFWISTENAYKTCLTIRKSGNTKGIIRPQKIEMCMELYNRVQSKVQQGIKFKEAVHMVVYEPAPRFYLTPESAYIILTRIKTRIKTKEDVQKL